MKLYLSVSEADFEGDLDWERSIEEKARAKKKDPEKERLEKERKVQGILSNYRVTIVKKMHELAEKRDHMTAEAVKRITDFINGLKKRYNEIFKSLYGEIYYKSVASQIDQIANEQLEKFNMGGLQFEDKMWHCRGIDRFGHQFDKSFKTKPEAEHFVVSLKSGKPAEHLQ